MVVNDSERSIIERAADAWPVKTRSPPLIVHRQQVKTP